MILSYFLCALFFVQNQIPFKAKDEFEVKLNYTLKQRPAVSEHNTYQYENQSASQNAQGVLPYLILNVKILKASAEEVRLKVSNNRSSNVMSKKLKEGDEFSIDIGFTDDVKDRVTAHEYTINLLDDKRKEQSKIVILVNKDGTFLINDEVRGKL
ncbi:MAG TPA: hypothetical protein PLJ60_09505 [Chryseolinea sp.]|nr:hypothetical protein [Chryseolinea sp.]HPM30559.1 hypothetical protein [Chryseolinea sp.]